MHDASERIMDWWRGANEKNHILYQRFMHEATCTLPGLISSGESAELKNIYEAVQIQRARLQQMQQVPEWTAVK